jgi:hypothetical protein
MHKKIKPGVILMQSSERRLCVWESPYNDDHIVSYLKQGEFILSTGLICIDQANFTTSQIEMLFVLSKDGFGYISLDDSSIKKLKIES